MGEAIVTEERWGGVGRRGGLKRLEKGGGGGVANRLWMKNSQNRWFT